MTVLVTRADAALIDYKLDQPAGGSGVAAVDVIVVKLADGDGATGLGFSYVLGGGGDLALQAAKSQLTRFVLNQPIVPPRAVWKKIYRTFNRSGLGPNVIGLAAVDTAYWDLYARRQELPLSVAMGGQSRAVPVYGSGGFNTVQTAEEAATVARSHVARGLAAVKPRVAGQPKDARVLSAVRDAVGSDVHVMADANEKCDLVSARQLMRVASEAGIVFVEEPLPSQALAGYRHLRSVSHIPIAAGEHVQDSSQLVALMTERIVSVVQPDLAMIGGITPILDLAVVAEALDVAMSPHFLPGLFVQVAAATTAIGWLEEFPLLEPLFTGWAPLDKDGTMQPTGAVGHGLELSHLGKARMLPRNPW